MSNLIFMGAMCAVVLFVVFAIKGVTEEVSGDGYAYLSYAGIFGAIAVILAHMI